MLVNTANKCSCKNTTCERHGKCRECVEFHKGNSQKPLPSCKRNQDSQP